MGLETGGRGGVERKRKKKKGEKTLDKYHKFDLFALKMHKPRIISIFPDPFGSFHLIHNEMILF